MSEKLIAKVLAAIQAGAVTSADVADETGLPLPSISATLSDLESDGVLKSSRRKVYRPNRHGDMRSRALKQYFMADNQDSW